MQMTKIQKNRKCTKDKCTKESITEEIKPNEKTKRYNTAGSLYKLPDEMR